LGHREVVELLVSRGADCDLRDSDDKSPFHYAVINGRQDLVDLMIDAGAEAAPGPRCRRGGAQR
jgi:ankyrin repeat protein